jgi:hypothetical protein
VSNRLVLEYHSVAEAVAVGGLDVASVCAVMLWRCAEVPAVDGMEGPRAAGVGFFMYLDSTPLLITA